MTTTAITATLLSGPLPMDPRRKKAVISLLLPESWTAAGVAIDLSAAALGSFTYITESHFTGVGIDDYDNILQLIGTEGTSANEGNLSASTCKVYAVRGAIKTGDAQAATVFGAVTATTNLSALACHLTVYGY